MFESMIMDFIQGVSDFATSWSYLSLDAVEYCQGIFMDTFSEYSQQCAGGDVLNVPGVEEAIHSRVLDSMTQLASQG